MSQVIASINPAIADIGRIEIHELVTSYGLHHDRRDFDSLANCFTPDASYVLRVANGQTFGPHNGRDAIIGQIRKFKESQSDIRRHHISNIQVYPKSPNEASVVSYVLVSAVTKEGALSIITVGTYTDTVNLTDAGWRISSKELLLESSF
jgi:3-phenylpropionate/cinnamic acid dioxygenase small subunit